MPPTVRDTPPTAAPIYLQVSWLLEGEVEFKRLRTVPVTVVTAPETPLSLLLPVGISAGKCSNREWMLCERLKSGESYFSLWFLRKLEKGQLASVERQTGFPYATSDCPRARICLPGDVPAAERRHRRTTGQAVLLFASRVKGESVRARMALAAERARTGSFPLRRSVLSLAGAAGVPFRKSCWLRLSLHLIRLQPILRCITSTSSPLARTLGDQDQKNQKNLTKSVPALTQSAPYSCGARQQASSTRQVSDPSHASETPRMPHAANATDTCDSSSIDGRLTASSTRIRKSALHQF